MSWPVHGAKTNLVDDNKYDKMCADGVDRNVLLFYHLEHADNGYSSTKFPNTVCFNDSLSLCKKCVKFGKFC